MSYKTIVVHVDKTDSAVERTRLAAIIAMNENAHLVGVAVTGIASFIYQAGLINSNAPDLTTHLETELEVLRQRAEQALDDFTRALQKMDVRSYETQMVDDEDEEFARRARCSDLVVVGQMDPEEPSPAVPDDFPERVVLSSGRPVFIVPYAARFDRYRYGSRVMIAWDASVPATRSIAGALPLLKRADAIEVVIFNPDDPQQGPDVVHYLAHHDVKAQVIRQQTDIDIGNALLSMATDLNTDAIVMGAYGHSRLREKLLGGVTRTVLQTMTVPVLMSA